MKHLVKLSERELVTVLNALHHWNVIGRPSFQEFTEDLEGGLLDSDEVEAFTDRLVSPEAIEVLCVIEKGLVSKAYVPDSAESMTVNVLDLDIEGVDEDRLTEFSVPMIGIVSGDLYGVERVCDAPVLFAEIAAVLDDGTAPHADDGQLDMFETDPAAENIAEALEAADA